MQRLERELGLSGRGGVFQPDIEGLLSAGDSIFWCIMHHSSLFWNNSLFLSHCAPLQDLEAVGTVLFSVSVGIHGCAECLMVQWNRLEEGKCKLQDVVKEKDLALLSYTHVLGLHFQCVSFQSIFITCPSASPRSQSPPARSLASKSFSCRKHLQDRDALFMPSHCLK